MKTYLIPSIRMTFVLMIICSVIYPLAVAAIGMLAPGNGSGVKAELNNRVVGYENIGQNFDRDEYFWGRPSAVGYNAAGSAGSNKGPTNPDYLALVNDRIDSFMVHNPGIKKSEIPVDMVTASGSGLDPDISWQAATIQIPRIAKARNISEQRVKQIVEVVREQALFGLLGPGKVNVLKLNIELDKIK